MTKTKKAPAKAMTRGELKWDYQRYLRSQRGLTETTISRNWNIVDRFLRFTFGDDSPLNLGAITQSDIAEFLQHLRAREQPLRDKNPSTHLRNFFRYLFKTANTDKNLALGVPSVAHRYGTRLPRHLTPEQVKTLIEAVSSEGPSSRRNLAMILLQARLGLRATEVVAIRIEDINWRSGEMTVRGKGKRHDRVPLPTDVGKAIADYIKLDRKSTSRVLFVTERPPHRPFTNAQILNLILRDAFKKTGLKPPAPYIGSHILRHSLATNLVRHGASLEEVADMLRHRSRASTLIYARLDVDGLRSVAQSWPVAGGAE
jgi:integrase/recombinase XerD